MSKCSVLSTLKSKFRYCTWFWPKYCADADVARAAAKSATPTVRTPDMTRSGEWVRPRWPLRRLMHGTRRSFRGAGPSYRAVAVASDFDGKLPTLTDVAPHAPRFGA